MISHYRVKVGRHQGKIGVMIGRFCDPSYNDIQLQFSDGSRGMMSYDDVEPIEVLAEAERSAEELSKSSFRASDRVSPYYR